MSRNQYDVIVLGAGASGLMCAALAAQRGRKVLILEKANKIGKKILMSGGGKCNFTNLSEQKLMGCLNPLGYDIEITVKPTASQFGHLGCNGAR